MTIRLKPAHQPSTALTMWAAVPSRKWDYDICSPQIQCNADKAGARVFEVFQTGNPKPCRVLDCTQSNIYQIERNAMRKIRRGKNRFAELFDSLTR